MVIDFEALLRGDPATTADNGHGALHIPIEILENSLDVFEWETQNYHWQVFKDGYASLHVAASIELIINYINREGEKIKRTFVGACNFPIKSIEPIPDWNATAKSLCIKNAASDTGKYFGRGINSEVLPERTSQVNRQAVLVKPDSKIMSQFLKAVEEKDEATITMLSNIYDIKTADNVEEE